MSTNINASEVISAFTLFSSADNPSEYTDIVNESIYEVSLKLRPSADSSDGRLIYLCASLANVKFNMINSARDKIAYTSLGAAAMTHNGQQQLDFAQKLFKSYLCACSDLLIDDTFCFINTSSCEE